MRKLSKILIIIFLLVNITTQFSTYGLIDNFTYANESKYSFSKLRLNGYGTISNTYDDNDKMSPFRDVSRSSIGFNSFDENSTWRLDSRLGLQAHYRFSQKVDFVLQGVMRDKSDPDFYNSIESAHLGLRPVPEIFIRLGRFSYDAFMMSDIRNTGYAYLWVRPPLEFYNWIPIFCLDGADASYSINLDDSQWSLRIQYGSNEMKVPMGEDQYSFETDDVLTLTLSGHSGPLTLKAGYSQFSPNKEVNAFLPLHKGLETIAQATSETMPDISKEASSLRNNIYFQESKITYMTLGASYDDGTWVAQAEIGKSTSEGDIIPNGKMGYISVGYRVGDFTPYLVFRAIQPNTNLHEPSSDWSLIGQEALQSQAIYIANSTRMEQHSYSLGLRWDFTNQAALKFQWDNNHIDPYGYGLWWREIELLPENTTINLYTLSWEFVF
ncbi:MAG: hypothetical protein HQK63_02190 [Desulfamplus sp.]|nr:hypothetical protein [Desulfamplus sp.]